MASCSAPLAASGLACASTALMKSIAPFERQHPEIPALGFGKAVEMAVHDCQRLQVPDCPSMMPLQFGCFWGAGQVCSATSRVLVQSSIAEAFYEQLKKRAEAIKICDPNEPECRLGPVVNQTQYEKILQFIAVSSSISCRCLDIGAWLVSSDIM